jgi:hypothetical protein
MLRSLGAKHAATMSAKHRRTVEISQGAAAVSNSGPRLRSPDAEIYFLQHLACPQNRELSAFSLGRVALGGRFRADRADQDEGR